MSEYREQAIKDVAQHLGSNTVLVEGAITDAVQAKRVHWTSEAGTKLTSYAVAQRERVLRLEANFEKLKWAAMHVIEMNKQQAIDQYGNILEAESWACVRTLRAALSEAL